MKVGTQDIYADTRVEIEYDDENDLVTISWTSDGGTYNSYDFGSSAEGLDEFIEDMRAVHQEALESALDNLDILKRRLTFQNKV